MATLLKEPKVEPAIDAGLAKALRTQQAVTEPYMSSKSQLQSGITEAQGREAQAKQKQEGILAEGAKTGLERETQAITGAQQTYQKEIEAEPLPAFIPTKDSATDIAGLFSLISVIGAVVGKKNAQMAMGNMNAMLEGHQKGRADLYKKERNEFDTNFKAMIKKHEEFRKKMEDAIKLAPRDKEKAMADAKIAAVEAGSDIVKAQLDRGFLTDAYKTVDELQKGITKVKEAYEKETAAESRHRESMAQRKKLAEIAAEAKGSGKATKSSSTQQQFENITSADIGNAYFRINEYLANSKDGKIPEGSKFLRDKGTQSGIIDAYKNYLVNATLPADLQKNDAALLGIAFDVVAARAFGRASGVTDSKIAQVVRQLPVQGDNESTKQTKMRILLNQLEEPNNLLPEEKRKDGATYMKSPVAKGLYRTYAEKIDTGEMKETEGLEDTSSGETSYMNQSEIDTERKNAKAALSRGAPENLVKERFRKTTGQEL
jgi:hypothetical protein